jgi:hypothetical protein
MKVRIRRMKLKLRSIGIKTRIGMTVMTRMTAPDIQNKHFEILNLNFLLY